MLNKTLAALAVCSMLASAGCFIRTDARASNGPQSTKDFNMTGFEKISSNGSMSLTVKVGGAESIKANGDQDRINNLKMSVEDGELVIKEDSKNWFGSHGKLHIDITLPKLTALAINGSGDATVDGVDSDSFSVSISGSGDITATGQAEKCTVSVSGSGDIDVSKIKSKSATVEIAGSGNIAVDASDTLDATISGSGNVSYTGDPKVTKQVAGSGSIKAAALK
ncbi:MAG TPA: head GIN domain-containing protein [Fimbriimonadaceae bacterium]|nr:head GIN domain-containing protein [Fimbriimonadaceae bacterium]